MNLNLEFRNIWGCNMYLMIGFSRPKNFNPISWIIRAVGGTSYSHTYIRIYSASIDRFLVYHASKKDIHFSNWNTFQRHNEIIEEYPFPVTQEQKREILQFCVDNIETPYGRLQLMGMGLVRIVKLWFDRTISNPLKDGTKSSICNELVGRILQKLGSDIKDSDLESQDLKFIRQKTLDLHLNLTFH